MVAKGLIRGRKRCSNRSCTDKIALCKYHTSVHPWDSMETRTVKPPKAQGGKGLLTSLSSFRLLGPRRLLSPVFTTPPKPRQKIITSGTIHFPMLGYVVSRAQVARQASPLCRRLCSLLHMFHSSPQLPYTDTSHYGVFETTSRRFHATATTFDFFFERNRLCIAN